MIERFEDGMIVVFFGRNVMLVVICVIEFRVSPMLSMISNILYSFLNMMVGSGLL